MPARIDDAIDDLYRGPLGEFTAARNALAKTLTGGDKARVARLTKPSMPMWAVNQLYWHDRPAYKALIDASEKLRAAHKAVLTGRTADVRKAEELHRTTVEKAFRRVIVLSANDSTTFTEPVREAIRRTLAALPIDEAAGRLTREPPPAGFSLLTGIRPAPIASPRRGGVESPRQAPDRETPAARAARSRADKQQRALAETLRRAAEKRERREAAEARRKAERDRRLQEKRAREIARAEAALKDAERRLAELKNGR